MVSTPSDVMGSTLIPSSPMRKGNSLVPCSAPRYFTTRKCRVAIWSLTRWSSKMTQSETYLPARDASAIRGPARGDDGRDAFFLEPAEEPAQFTAQDGFRWAGWQTTLPACQHHALAPMESIACPAGRTILPDHTRHFPGLRCARCERNQ